MRQRIATGFGLIIALMMTFLPVLGAPAAATAQKGLQGDVAYESPQFGYTLEWGSDWSVRGRDVISNRGGYDTITLRGQGGILWIQGQGADVNAADAVEKRIEIEGSSDDVVSEDLDGDVPTVEMVTGRSRILIEGHTLETNKAVVLVVLSAREKDFDAALDSVREQVLFNGGPILTGQEATEGDGDAIDTTTGVATEEATVVPTETPEDAETDDPVDLTDGESGMATVTDVVDGTYTGPLYGYTFEFDEDIWTVGEELDGDGSDGLYMTSDTGSLTIWSWDAYGTDTMACLDGESDYYANDDQTVEDWSPALDANGDPIRYEGNDYAYGVFTLTYTNPDSGETTDLVDYIECRSIPGEDAVVIIFGSSTPDLYNDHLDMVLDVAETITFAQDDEPIVDQPDTPPDEDDMPETGLSGSLYTSPSFGFTVDIPQQWQVEDEQLALNDEQLMLTNGTSDVMIWATDAYNGDLAGCVDFAAEHAPYDLELATTAEGGPFRGDDRNGAYGNFLYDDGDQAYSISCQYIEEGESVLILTQDVPADELASQRKFRIDLQQAIELP